MVTEIKPMYLPKIQPDNEGVVYKQIPSSAIAPVEADLVPAIPSEVLLGSLRDGRLRVHSPIKVRFVREGKHIVAEAVELNEFGFGENPTAALIDLQRAVAELYFTLQEEQDHLGKDLHNVWADIQKKIRKHDD